MMKKIMENFTGIMTRTMVPLLVALASCRETELVIPSPEPPAPSVQSLTLSPSRLFLKVGDIRKLSYRISPDGAAGVALSWKTGSRAIASINTAGMVTANSEGVTTIHLKAVDFGIEAACEVTVVAAYDSLILPLTGTTSSCTKAKVTEYESRRGSVLDTVRSNENYLFFKTRSQVFPETVYVYDGRDFYVQAFSVPRNGEVLGSEDFKALVTASGFHPRPRSFLPGADNYSNGIYDLRVHPRSRQVDIRYYPDQKRPMPSWKDIPVLGMYPFFGNAAMGIPGGSMDEVAAFERQEHHCAGASFSHADARTVGTFETDGGNLHRWYFYHGTPGAEDYEGQAYHVNLLWKDISKAFRVEGQDVWITDEFDSMVQDSGWSFSGSAGGYFWYGRPAVVRGEDVWMYFGVRAVRFSDFNEGEYSLQIQAYIDWPQE